jgi:hypothetical protein
MKMEWNKFEGKNLHVALYENYGLTIDPHSDSPVYEIVCKSGKLIKSYDDGLLLEASMENEQIGIFIPYQSIKCVEIFNI